MKTLKNLLKKIAPTFFLASQSCSHDKPSISEIDKINHSEEMAMYQSFKSLLEEKNYLFSGDGETSAWIDNKRNCAMIKKVIDDKLSITYRDYGIDGLEKNDEYVENFTSSRLEDLNPKSRASISEAYGWEVKRILQYNQIGNTKK